MLFESKTLNSQTWTLVVSGVNNITFSNIGQYNIYVIVTDTSTPPSDLYGVVYTPNESVIAKAITDFGSGTYLWAKSSTGFSKISYKVDDTVVSGGGSGGTASSVTVTQSALPTGAATESTLVNINNKLANTLNVEVNSTVLPTGAATETTLLNINNKLANTLNVAVNSTVLPTGAATETTLVNINNKLANTLNVAVNSTVLPTDAATETSLVNINNTLSNSAILVKSITGDSFNENFTSFPNTRWNVEVKSSGDIIKVDGNAAATNYLVVSLDPLVNNTETFISSNSTYAMPFEYSIGASLSQRTIGQDISFGFFSDEAETQFPDLQITSIQQATTTLTVSTNVAHNFRVGSRIGIRGVSDSRLNYVSLVVASTPTKTQFTATAGPGGTIPSLTVGPYTSGYVYFKSPTYNRKSAFVQTFENATASNASFFVKTSSSVYETNVGGTLAGNQSSTISSSASIQAINAALNYAFRPTSEYRIYASQDKIQFVDSVVDTTAEATARGTITQIIPDFDKKYRIGFRLNNTKSYQIPNAQIISVSKSGTTTATVTTDVAHGLTTSDYINIYGVRDTTNFANLTTATVVASVISSTQFTIVWGSAVTATSYGGYISRANGAQIIQGAITQVAQTFARTSNIVTLIGSAAWTGLLIGDYINIVGGITSGGISLGIDGAYKVMSISTTTLTLEPLSATLTGADITTTNIGGGVIKRTDLRINFLKMVNIQRLRTEMSTKASGDLASSIPISVKNATIAVTQSGNWSLLGGTSAEDAATSASPVITGGVARTAVAPTTIASGDAVRTTLTTGGATTIQPFAVPEVSFQYFYETTTETSLVAKAAGAASIRNYVASLQFQNTSATATYITVLDGSTVIAKYYAPANMSLPACINYRMPIRGTAATALNIGLSVGTACLINVQGYQAM